MQELRALGFVYRHREYGCYRVQVGGQYSVDGVFRVAGWEYDAE